MNSKLLCILGYNYSYDIGVIKDKKKAFKYYIKAAELENPVVINDVSTCYYGFGEEKDYQKLFEYCKKSAD